MPLPLASPRKLHGLFAGFFICMAVTVSSADTAKELPGAPLGSFELPASSGRVIRGEAWLSNTDAGASGFHMHGASTVAFDLSLLKLTAGHYIVGAIARTGTRWADATDQVPRYRFHVKRSASAPKQLPPLTIPIGSKFQPVMGSGNPGSWGNWYGVLQSPAPLYLNGNEAIHLENLENHGGVLILWVQPVHAQNSVAMTLETSAPQNAFIINQTPAVDLQLHLPEGLPAVDTMIESTWLDLLTESEITTRQALQLKPGETRNILLERALLPGVYRISATLIDPESKVLIDNPSGARLTLATAPARLANSLPDDWPMGAHVNASTPPLPGFRWYRYFAQWAEINPAPDTFVWGEFDRIFADVREVGGKLLIASDGAPLWTSAKEKAGMPWSAEATAHPPDDWQTLRDYLDALIERYHDETGTLGALEHWNEANTETRWLGDSYAMLEMADVFDQATAHTDPTVKTVGLAISAGDFRGYAKEIIDAGLLKYVDAVSAHFYEELMSFEASIPINNLPRHVAMLAEPMKAAGIDLPMLNTESGIEFVSRAGGRLVSQTELNSLAEAHPDFDPAHPWMLSTQWRAVSERRAAAGYVSGTVLLMAHDVRQSFYFTQYKFLLDGAPSFPWVALAQLGNHLYDVDYSVIRPLKAHYPASDGGDGSPAAFAFELGQPDGERLIVAWGYLRDTSVGRPKGWQPWLAPRSLTIETEISEGHFSDLYSRRTETIRSAGGRLQVDCGEEPIFIRISPACCLKVSQRLKCAIDCQNNQHP